MITVLEKPPLYSPLNTAKFKITSNLDDIINFKVELIDYTSFDTIAVQKYAALPMLTNGTVFDLAPLLSSFVDTQIDTSADIVKTVPQQVRIYKVKVTEFYLDEAGIQQEASPVTLTDNFTIWNGTLSRLDYKNYNLNQYVTGTASPSNFLNLRPVISNVYPDSTQYLYLISNVTCYVKINYFKNGVGLVDSETISAHSLSINAYRLNVSPDVVNDYVGEGIEFNYYTIQIVNGSGSAISELRTFVIRGSNCKEKIEVFFQNNLGGVDSMVFLNPKQSITTARTTIESNPYQFDSSGNYTEIKNGIFNPTDVTISAKTNNTFTMISESLSDDDSKFAAGLIESKRVYIKTSDGDLLPVSIVETDYQIAKKKYSTSNNRLTVSFKISDVNLNI